MGAMKTCELCGTEYSILYDSHGIHHCVDALREENARLHQLCAFEAAGRAEAEAEVKRLEGLILDWDEHYDLTGYDNLKAEAKRIRGEK